MINTLAMVHPPLAFLFLWKDSLERKLFNKINFEKNYNCLLGFVKYDGIVKSRHSRACARSASARRRENGNPENSNYMKTLDSCFRRNDKKYPSQTFYETIKYF